VINGSRDNGGMSRTDYVVSPAAIPPQAQVFDVRWALGEAPGAGLAAYRAGHIPGARFLGLESVLTQHGLDPTLGRHPLPSADWLAAGLGEAGLETDRPIIVYDVPGTSAASRAWWVLRWAGLDVRVLDGGWPAWLASGGEVETAAPGVAPTSPSLTVGHMPTVDAAAVATWPGSLIDVRAPARFRGEAEPIDAKAGHIPGAVNVPVSTLWTSEGTLPTESLLRYRFGELRRPVAVSCGSGITATQGIMALAVLGVEAALYAPSWSGWIADPAHPVATGE